MKTINNIAAALAYVMQEKRDWLANAEHELDTTISLGKDDSADYWRSQIVRTHGAINALAEVVEMVNSEEV